MTGKDELFDNITPVFGRTAAEARKSTEELCRIIEAILFACGEPVELARLAEATQTEPEEIDAAAEKIMREYEGKGIHVIKVRDALQMVTASEMYDYVYAVADMTRKQQLSQAAYETLSVIAYRQPVTKAVIEKIRGVNCDSAVSRLMERGLIRETGRLDAPGRPIIYETTDEFLRCMGYSDVSELPKIEGEPVIEEAASEKTEENED